MRECEATGKNIEQAIQNALLELKASREDVDIKILSEGGFLKKAKVLVSISEDALEKYEKKEKFKASLAEEKTDEDFAENFVKAKIEKTETKKQKIIADEEYVKPEKQETLKEEYDEPKTETANSKEKTERKFTPQEFIDGVLSAMGLQGTLEQKENERFEYYNLTGENLNDLIGHHGDCMTALSFLMSTVCKGETRKRLVLDIENYREKREESLRQLAKRTADKVAKTKRYHKFEPMDPAERRIIHLTLQDDDRVTTLSKGDEPNRYLMVFPKDYGDR